MVSRERCGVADRAWWKPKRRRASGCLVRERAAFWRVDPDRRQSHAGSRGAAALRADRVHRRRSGGAACAGETTRPIWSAGAMCWRTAPLAFYRTGTDFRVTPRRRSGTADRIRPRGRALAHRIDTPTPRRRAGSSATRRCKTAGGEMRWGLIEAARLCAGSRAWTPSSRAGGEGRTRTDARSMRLARRESAALESAQLSAAGARRANQGPERAARREGHAPSLLDGEARKYRTGSGDHRVRPCGARPLEDGRLDATNASCAERATRAHNAQGVDNGRAR